MHRTVTALLGEQGPDAEDQSLRESGSVHDDYDDEESESVNAAPSEVVDGKERMAILWGRPSKETEMGHAALIDPYDGYKQILNEAEASAWLLSTLKRDLALQGIVPSAMHAVRETVLKLLRRNESGRDLGGKPLHVLKQMISRNRAPRIYVAHFEVEWDPVTFVNQEFLEMEPRDHISRVITVTGEGDILQALPCQDYMMQTWPFSAPKVLALIQSLIAEPYKVYDGKNNSSSKSN